MLGNTHSLSRTGFSDIDNDDSFLAVGNAFLNATGVAESSRRTVPFDPNNGLGAYVSSRYRMRRRNSETLEDTKGRLPGKGAASPKKSYKRGGRAHTGKTKSLKSVTSNQMHAAVFPNMRVPVYMRKNDGMKNRSGHGVLGGSGRSLSVNSRGESVPVMSVQCPLPGGTSVTLQTDPVQKVTWGPISRIEATGHAKDLVKKLRKAIKAAKKSKGKNKTKGKEGDESEAESEEASKPVKSSKGKESARVAEQSDNAAVQYLTAEDGITFETASLADSEITGESIFNAGRRGFSRAPPATPGDEAFFRSPCSAAAMSMPTIPTMHHIADPKLVEHFRIFHAVDPEAFENETREIKQGLIEAKIKRGGLPFLLREEYTVELASREGAEIAEKWASGQGRCREYPGQRTRSNSLTSQPSSGSLRMRGGEIDETSTIPAAPRALQYGTPSGSLFVTNPAPPSSPVSYATEQSEKNEHVPTLDISGPGLNDEPSAAEPNPKDEEKSTTKGKSKPKHKMSIKEIKKALSRLNVSDNVTKVTTYGSVRHQSSVKREATDHGEKRTVKTWIEITEIYDVPKPQKLTVKDIADAVKQEDEDHEASGNEWESDSDDSESDFEPGEKEIARKKRAKAKKSSGQIIDSPSSTSSESSDSDSDTDTDNDTDSDGVSDNDSIHGAGIHDDPNETSAESLLRSLLHLGEDTGYENLTRLGNDYSAIIAGLSGEGMVRDGADDSEDIGL